MSDETERRERGQSFIVSLSITGTERQRWAAYKTIQQLGMFVCLCNIATLLITLSFEEKLRVQTGSLITNSWKRSKCSFLVPT